MSGKLVEETFGRRVQTVSTRSNFFENIGISGKSLIQFKLNSISVREAFDLFQLFQQSRRLLFKRTQTFVRQIGWSKSRTKLQKTSSLNEPVYSNNMMNYMLRPDLYVEFIHISVLSNLITAAEHGLAKMAVKSPAQLPTKQQAIHFNLKSESFARLVSWLQHRNRA